MDDLILRNKGLVSKVINDLHCKYMNREEFEELYQIGIIGLVKSAKQYDGSVKESTYFYTCIKREILKMFAYRTRQKEIPIGKKLSINFEYNEDTTLENFLVSDIDIEEEVISDETKEEVRKVIKKLKPIYQEVLNKFFGIGCAPMKLGEIAKERHCTENNIYGVFHNAKRSFEKEWLKYENNRSKK